MLIFLGEIHDYSQFCYGNPLMHIVWRKRDVPCSNGVEVEQYERESRCGISYDALGRYTGCTDFKSPRLYEAYMSNGVYYVRRVKSVKSDKSGFLKSCPREKN